MRHKATARKERRDHLAHAMDRSVIQNSFSPHWAQKYFQTRLSSTQIILVSTCRNRRLGEAMRDRLLKRLWLQHTSLDYPWVGSPRGNSMSKVECRVYY